MNINTITSKYVNEAKIDRETPIDAEKYLGKEELKQWTEKFKEKANYSGKAFLQMYQWSKYILQVDLMKSEYTIIARWLVNTRTKEIKKKVGNKYVIDEMMTAADYSEDKVNSLLQNVQHTVKQKVKRTLETKLVIFVKFEYDLRKFEKLADDLIKVKIDKKNKFVTIIY